MPEHNSVNYIAVNSNKKQLGQFMTPKLIADFMAKQLIQGMRKNIVNILEPSAGNGSLVVAIFEQIVLMPKKPDRIEFVLYEIDSKFILALKLLAKNLRVKAKTLGIKIKFSIRNKDFLLHTPEGKFDIVIANPPFFKLKKNDPRSQAHKYVIHGQPNIYGLFMAACAQLLNDDGRYCFLTPRSWTSGSYFIELRKFLFKQLQFEAIHLFQDREATFKRDRIQQEMMITWAKTQTYAQEDVMLSSSYGLQDLNSYNSKLVSFSNIFASKPCKSINLPFTKLRYDIRGLNDTLLSIGLNVSTGKVVPFRSINWIRNRKSKNTVPLLWMSHVTKTGVCWPLKVNREHFVNITESEKLLIAKGNYVLIRRFSPRDQENWITAAALLMDDTSTKIGIENHLNYIYSTSNPLTNDEAIGLACYLNSKQVRSYFFSRIGHTQINAADLKTLPMLNRAKLSEIGRKKKLDPQIDVTDLVQSLVMDKQNVLDSDLMEV